MNDRLIEYYFFLSIFRLTSTYDFLKVFRNIIALTFTTHSLCETTGEGLFSFGLTMEKLRPTGISWLF